MSRKVNIYFGAGILLSWISLIFVYIFTSESLFAIIFIILAVFLMPMLISFISALLGEIRVQKIKSSFQDFITMFGKFLMISVSTTLLFSGIGTICYQFYLYLKAGEWTSYSVIYAFNKLGSTWAKSPNDWVGFWEILEFLPISLVLIVCSFLILSLSEK
jgi:hypothetical protein